MHFVLGVYSVFLICAFHTVFFITLPDCIGFFEGISFFFCIMQPSFCVWMRWMADARITDGLGYSFTSYSFPAMDQEMHRLEVFIFLYFVMLAYCERSL